MNQNAIYIRVLLVVVSIVVLFSFLNRSPRHAVHDPWLPSSFNPVGAGNMALFQTLHDLDWPVERWRDPLSRLSQNGTGNALLITRSRVGWRVAFTEQETGLLDDWVKQGNTLYLFGAFSDWEDTRTLLRQIGFALSEDSPNSVSSFFQPFKHEAEKSMELQPAPGSGRQGTLILPPTSPLPLTFPPNAHVLWQEQGQPYVIQIPHGKGSIVCAASDRLLSNAYLDQGDNLAVVLQLLAPDGKPPNHLYFEEGHHGFSAIYALARLLDHPGVRFAGMLALLGGLAFFGSAWVRFGQVIPLHREAGRSTLEFVDSIADLYRQADIRNEVVKYLFVETHQRVLQRLNLPPTATHDLIASRLQQAHPHLPKWKKLAQRFDSTDHLSMRPVDGLPPSGWLRVAHDLIQIKSAMA